MFAFVRNALRRRPAPTDTANINTTAEAPAAGAFSLLRSLRSRWPLRAWSSLLPPPLLQAFATRRVVFVALLALAALGAAAALTPFARRRPDRLRSRFRPPGRMS